jgi:hypothetical protein
METEDYKREKEKHRMTVKEKQGIAATMGYVNRKAWRNFKYAEHRKTRNTSLNQIPEFTIGSVRKGAPIFEPRRKKFKGWQRNQRR